MSREATCCTVDIGVTATSVTDAPWLLRAGTATARLSPMLSRSTETGAADGSVGTVASSAASELDHGSGSSLPGKPCCSGTAVPSARTTTVAPARVHDSTASLKQRKSHWPRE